MAARLRFHGLTRSYLPEHLAGFALVRDPASGDAADDGVALRRAYTKKEAPDP